MDYYEKTQFIAQVNKVGEILGKVEKWEAHKEGILHKAFSVTIIYRDQYLLQHRKHPVFDGVFDLSCSSHPLYKGEKLESDEDAVMKTLKREWGISKKDIKGAVKDIGEIYYRAKDEKSRYVEHELCVQYLVEVKKLPVVKPDFAYGYSLVTKEELGKKRSRVYENLAPWAKKAVALL
jgi:isopentenyl-diphosphate delta-isomerase type 1